MTYNVVLELLFSPWHSSHGDPGFSAKLELPGLGARLVLQIGDVLDPRRVLALALFVGGS